MASNKTKAWEVYRDYYSRTTKALPDAEFETVWRSLDSYVRGIVRGKVFNCSDFDLDDYLAEAQLLLWQRMSQRRLPAHDRIIFVGSIRVVVQQMLGQDFRRDERERKARDIYAGGLDHVQHQCLAMELWAGDVLKKHRDIVAKLMVERSRFPVVSLRLAIKVVAHMRDNAKLDEVKALIKKTGFWDPYFLLAYLPVLYRWCYYDVRAHVLEAA